MYIIYDDILNGFQKLSFELVMVGVNVLSNGARIP